VTQRTRVLVVAAALVVIVVAFVIASSGGDDGGDGSAGDAATTPPAETTTSPAPGGQTSTDDTATTTTTTPAEPAAPSIPTVRVVGGKPQGGVRRLEFEKGDTIRFRVRSDVADEVHVHGYDVAKDVRAGGSVTFSIPATIDGRFEVELEGRHEQIAELEVQP
jgi:hypothetical protein